MCSGKQYARREIINDSLMYMDFAPTDPKSYNIVRVTLCLVMPGSPYSAH